MKIKANKSYQIVKKKTLMMHTRFMLLIQQKKTSEFKYFGEELKIKETQKTWLPFLYSRCRI